MKKFILQAVSFCLIALVLIGGFCAVEVWAEVASYQRELKAPRGATAFVCGDSMAEHGLNPECWPELFNFSVSGRPLDQTYLTVLDVLGVNPGQFRTLILDVSPIGVSRDYHTSVGEMEHANRYVLLYMLHLDERIRDMSGACQVFRELMVEERLQQLRRLIYKKRYKFSSSLASGYAKESHCLKVERPESYRARLMDRHKMISKGMAECEKNLRYLEILRKTIQYARSRGLEVVLITTPLNDDQKRLAGEDAVARFSRWAEQVASDNGCRYFNGLSLRLEENLWMDGNHLNRFGAQEFTARVRAFAMGGK